MKKFKMFLEENLKTLYVRRNLLNAKEFLDHYRKQGFSETLSESEVHLTIAFSKKAVNWNDISKHIRNYDTYVNKTDTIPLGDKGAIICKLLDGISYFEDRHKDFKEIGCSWDYDSYQPHITITYKGFDGNLEDTTPYKGFLKFGPEIFSEVESDWDKKIKRSETKEKD